MSANAIVEVNSDVTINELEIKKLITDMQIFAKNLDVTQESAFKKITSIYADAKTWDRIIEQKRKEGNAPFQSRINENNDRAKEITEPLKLIQEICKRKADGYQRMLEEQKRKEREAIESAAAIFDAEMPYLPPAPTNHRGDGAVAYSKTETKFRCIDLALVPRKYLMLDEDAVKRDIKLGIAEIAGIEIYQTKTTQLKLR